MNRLQTINPALFVKMVPSKGKRALLCSLVATVIFCGQCSAAFEYTITGARPAAMGGAFVALANDPDALVMNPAGLTRIAGNIIGVSYSRPYGLSNLSLGILGYVHPTGKGAWGLGLRSFGNGVYRENTFGLSRGNAFGETIHFGATINVFHLSIQRFGTATAIGIDLGTHIRLSKELWAGLSISNINTPNLGKSGERLPRRIHLGLRSSPEKDLICVAELQTDMACQTQFRIGQEYRISPFLSIRFGLSTGPTNFTGGAGFYLGRHRIDYAYTSHSVLGATHQASMTIHIGGSSGESNTHQDK